MSLFRRNPQPPTAGRRTVCDDTPEPGRFARLFRVVRRLAWTAAIVAVLGFLGIKGRDFLYESSYFQIRNVVIDGVGDEITAEIQKRLESEEGPANLLAASPGAIRTLLLDTPAIHDVTVRRHLPDTLVIEATERHPVVILVGERNYLLDSELVAMGTVEGKDFLDSQLPLITVDAPPPIELGDAIEDSRVARSWVIVSELRKQSSELAMKISETHVDGDGNITLHLDGGMEVRLGQRSAVQVLPVLEAFYRKTDGMQQLEYAELEFRNQVAFKRRGVSVPQPAATDPNERDGESLPTH